MRLDVRLHLLVHTALNHPLDAIFNTVQAVHLVELVLEWPEKSVQLGRVAVLGEVPAIRKRIVVSAIHNLTNLGLVEALARGTGALDDSEPADCYALFHLIKRKKSLKEYEVV
jgi:hypothetical protein